MAEPLSLQIDIIADVVCPWCYLGKRRMDRAMARVPDVSFLIGWHPFLLNATLPAGGLPYHAYLASKLGGTSAVKDGHARLGELGKAAGIDYRFDLIERMSNTIDAHRLIHWAGEAGVANPLVEILYRRHFSEGQDVGSHGVLALAAAEAGMNASEVSDWLATDTDRDGVMQHVAESQRMGITGVPCFIIEKKYAVMGAQEEDALVEALNEIAEEKRFGAKV